MGILYDLTLLHIIDVDPLLTQLLTRLISLPQRNHKDLLIRQMEEVADS